MTSIPPIVIGLTGNIGSGKSTASAFFAKNGFSIVDADLAGRHVVEKSASYRHWLRERFGNQIFNGETLDRAALGRIVFSDIKARDDMNEKIRPYINEQIDSQIKTFLAAGKPVLVDAALIFEWNQLERYDAIVAVVVPPEVGVQRAAQRMSLTFEEVMNRYKMQVPMEEKAARSDYIVKNTGTLEELEANVLLVIEKIAKRFH